MLTESGKTPFFISLTHVQQQVHDRLKLTKAQSPWFLESATIEKMKELMAASDSKVLGMYDKLSNFLAHINITLRERSV